MENASLLDRCAAIENEFQEPLRDVVAGFIPLGLTRTETAETLGVSAYSLRKYCETSGIHFPRYQPGRNARIRSAVRRSRCARILTLDGERRCLSEWAELHGIKRHTLAMRMRRGRSLRDALRA